MTLTYTNRGTILRKERKTRNEREEEEEQKRNKEKVEETEPKVGEAAEGIGNRRSLKCPRKYCFRTWKER